MKKTLLLSVMILSVIAISACGKKKDEGAVIIQAQDNGRDTTTSELAKGDTAGRAESDISTEEKAQQEIKENEVADGWHADIDREITILGEWDCTDGSHWVLDNGYNLKYSDGSQELIGNYSFTYSTGKLGFTFWNIEHIEEIDDTDENGEFTGTTHEYKTYIKGTKKYEILGYEHNDDYTTGTLKLKDENGKEVTATLKTPIAVDLKATSATENKRKFDAEQEENRLKEEAYCHHMSLEDYKAFLKAIEDGEIILDEDGNPISTAVPELPVVEEVPAE